MHKFNRNNNFNEQDRPQNLIKFNLASTDSMHVDVSTLRTNSVVYDDKLPQVAVPKLLTDRVQHQSEVGMSMSLKDK